MTKEERLVNTATTDDERGAAAMTDPARTERMGKAIATEASALDVSTVVCWDLSEDAVLAHVVARELGVGLVRAVEIEGIVALLQPIADGARTALVAEIFRARTGLAGLSGVVAHAGGVVVAVGSASGAIEVADTEAAGARVVSPDEAR